MRSDCVLTIELPAKSKGQQAPKRRSQVSSIEESATASAPIRAVPQPSAPSDEQLLMEALEEWDDEQLSPVSDAARTISPTPVLSPALASAVNKPKPLPLPVSFDLSAPFREISLADQIAAISQQHVTPTRYMRFAFQLILLFIGLQYFVYS